MVYISGFFNIDSLNPTENSIIIEFIHTVYSMNLYPLTTHPKRMTSHSATIIDNILTNVINRNVECGLIIDYLRDHLPVFAVVLIITRTHRESRIKKKLDIKHMMQSLLLRKILQTKTGAQFIRMTKM